MKPVVPYLVHSIKLLYWSTQFLEILCVKVGLAAHESVLLEPASST